MGDKVASACLAFRPSQLEVAQCSLQVVVLVVLMPPSTNWLERHGGTGKQVGGEQRSS